MTWVLSSAGEVFADPGAPGGSQAHLWSAGTATATVSGAGQIRIFARAQLCEGPPAMEVFVDGRSVGRVDVHVSRVWGEYRVGDFEIPAGDHEVVVRFAGDRLTSSCDRNLHLGGADLVPPPPAGTAQLWALDGNGVVIPDLGAPGNAQAHLWSNGRATTRASGSGVLTIYARGEGCAGGDPWVQVLVDGVTVGWLTVVNPSGWWSYPVGDAIGPGEHEVTVRYLSDFNSDRCDRNVRVGGATFVSAG